MRPAVDRWGATAAPRPNFKVAAHRLPDAGDTLEAKAAEPRTACHHANDGRKLRWAMSHKITIE
jgi:hypothetical protein